MNKSDVQYVGNFGTRRVDIILYVFVRFDLKHRLRLGTYHISCLGIFLDLFFLHRTDRTERELEIFFCQPLHLFLHLICGGFKSVVFTQQCHGCTPPECSIACKAPCSGFHRFGSSKASDRRTRDRSLSFLNASVNVDITTY